VPGDAAPPGGRGDANDGLLRGGRALPQGREFVGDMLRLDDEVRGGDVSDAKRLKALEEENAKLKRVYADAMLDNAGLKEPLSYEW
jgi:hypothetical protein